MVEYIPPREKEQMSSSRALLQDMRQCHRPALPFLQDGGTGLGEGEAPGRDGTCAHHRDLEVLGEAPRVFPIFAIPSVSWG